MMRGLFCFIRLLYLLCTTEDQICGGNFHGSLRHGVTVASAVTVFGSETAEAAMRPVIISLSRGHPWAGGRGPCVL